MNIRHTTYLFSVLIILAVGVSSCINSTGYEDIPLEQNTEQYTFNESDSLGENAKKFLNSIYGTLELGHNRVGGDYLDAASDDAVTSNPSTTVGVTRLVTGNYTAFNTVGSEMQWGDYYSAIRNASLFVNKIQKVPVMETFQNGLGEELSLKYAWKSEVRFIRAWHYFNLLKRYGGVPLMGDKVRQLGDNVEIPRSSFEEVVNYIVSELDAIKDSLRTRPIANLNSDSHVVTESAAMALKSRVLLYAASPLFNGENIDEGNELTGYTNYDADRWVMARDAAETFLQEYTQFGLVPNYGDIFTTKLNQEIIFFRNAEPHTFSVEEDNAPIGMAVQAEGRTSPTQNLAEAFPMQDGTPINESSAYDPGNPYQNRDPRFYETLMYNQDTWLNNTVQTFEGGRSKPGGNVQQTKTSYYLRKFMGDFESQDDYSDVDQNWIIFRYAEMLLNYAEAENEVNGPSPEVYDVLEQLRDRAGIAPGPNGNYGLEQNMTKDEMREAIHNERRIEMTFEEQRYWDIRRWRKAEDIFNQPLTGMVIVRNGPFFAYNEVPVLDINFEPNRYLYPIPYDEVVENSQMVQNPGWLPN